MLTRIRSAYLRNEMKYDRWGAQGKILAVLEILRAEGIDAEGLKLEKLVNAAFPRTFSCQCQPGPGDMLPQREEVRREVLAMAVLLEEWGIDPSKAEFLAVEEIGERRCLDAAFLREYLKS
jgi:hypothetical protein